MRRRIRIASVTTVTVLALGAALPATGADVAGSLAGPSTAAAAVQKSLSGKGGGGGSVGGSGGRLADLLSGIAVPVVIAFAGILLIGTLASRNIGASLGIVVVTLIGLIFLLSPSSIEGLAKGIANVVF